MANLGGYVGLDRVIEKAYGRAGYETIDWARAINVISNVIPLIGVGQALEDAIKIVRVLSYQASLPSDFYSSESLRYVVLAGETIPEGDPIPEDATVASMATMVHATDSFYLDSKTSSSPHYRYTYRINAGIIQTNFEEGYIQIAYKKFKTDETNGFPLVPSDERYINALEKSIIEDNDYRLWRAGKLNQAVYQHSQQEKEWAIASARSGGNIPSMDEMEAIKNTITRTIDMTNSHQNAFRTSNLPEVRYHK